MTKRTRNILIAVAAALVLLNVLSVVIKRMNGSPLRNIAGVLSSSETAVKINDVTIPSYNFGSGVYIAAEDLRLFGFSVEETDEDINISNSEADYAYHEEYLTSLSHIKENTNAAYPDKNVFFNGEQIQAYVTRDYTIIPIKVLDSVGVCQKSDTSNAIVCTLLTSEELTQANNNNDAKTLPDEVTVQPPTVAPGGTSVTLAPSSSGGKVIVLDPGHGKSSSEMTDSEKEEYGWTYNESTGTWGEWRHWKSGTLWEECGGSGCCGRVTSNGGEWYPMGNGDRDTEPDINLQNCLAAKKYLEEMGYTVRMTRQSNDENPSFSKRMSYCCPGGNTSSEPDAAAYICVHSNAGGGSGTHYIQLSGTYDQAGIPSDYVEQSNALGKAINDKVAEASGLSNCGALEGMPELIAFFKSPVPCAYMEIGFFDNSSDLSILKSSSDEIGKAIAEGINEALN